MSTTELKTKLERLRVAQGELCSGDTTGSVYTQLSPGSAMFLTDRFVAVANVSKEIRAVIEHDEREAVVAGGTASMGQ
jgi:hypothetical protein